jgi:hypothetical protein
MSFFKQENESKNFPPLASRNALPNLWLKYSRTDRTPLARDECNASFNALLKELRAHAAFAARAAFTDLASFDPETHMGVLEEFLQSALWPKVPKELKDPVGHTAFAASDLRSAWQNCGRLDFGTALSKALADDFATIFRTDNYGNVISLFARPNSPVASAYDHFFPYSRGGRTRSVPGSTETNIIMIQWKANSIKSDTIEQLLQPSELCTGLTPEQVINALKSSNGFYGVPAVPFLLGFDPLLDCSCVPDRSDVFANWKAATVEGGKCFRDQVVDALVRVREAEVKREQAYVDRKQKRADRKESSQTKVNPYTFQAASASSSPAPAVDIRLLEYGVFLRATLVDGQLDPAEIDALAHLRGKHGISDAEHETVLRDSGLADTYAAALAKAAAAAAAPAAQPKPKTKKERLLEAIAKAAATAVDDEAPVDRAVLSDARSATGATDETNKFLSEQFDAVQGKLQCERLAAFTVPELRAKCRSLELPVSGKKEELVARITERLMADDARVATKQSAATSIEDALRALSDAELRARAAAEKLTIPPDAAVSKLTLFRFVADSLTALAALPTSNKSQLVAAARERGVAVSGTKEQLHERLRAAILAAKRPVVAANAAQAAPAAAFADALSDDEDAADEPSESEREKLSDASQTRIAALAKFGRAELEAECAKLQVPTAGAADDAELRRRLQVAVELSTASLAELRAKCVIASLKVKGNKATLRDRLLAALAPTPTTAAPSAAAPSAAAPETVLTKVQLVDQCRQLGLKVSGTKEELIARIAANSATTTTNNK